MIRSLLRAASLPILAAAAVLLLSQPQAAALGFSEGVQLCLRSVLPALFPFFVVSGLMVSHPAGRLLAAPLRPVARAAGFQDSETPLFLLLSWLGGYAVCARLAGEAVKSGKYRPADAERLLVLGCCSGPGFVIGCVGGLMLGSVRTGVLLYGLQLSANFAAAAFLRLFTPCRPRRSPPRGREAIPAGDAAGGLAAAISGAVDSCLSVCGCVLFFRVVSAVLERLLTPGQAASAFLRAGMEITAGCDAFAALGGRYALWGVCLCLSGLGCSVFAQLRQLTGGAVPLGRLVLSRAVHLVVLQILIRLCGAALPGDAEVFRSLRDPVVVACRLPPDCALLLLCFMGGVLYKIGRKFYNRKQ